MINRLLFTAIPRRISSVPSNVQASMNKSYEHDHMEKRARTAYQENCRRVKQHNEDAQNGKYSFEIRANHLADMSQSTYLKHFTRLIGDIHPHSPHANGSKHGEELLGSVHQDFDDGSQVPDALDWRQLGYRTDAKNQATCGSCYAFSIASAVEAQIFRRTGKIVPLSVQQIVDCSSSAGNGGCRGGSLSTTIRYLKSTKGLMRLIDYPYKSEVFENESIHFYNLPANMRNILNFDRSIATKLPL